MNQTQVTLARSGEITPAIQAVAQKENRPVEFIRERVADGRIVEQGDVRIAFSGFPF